MSSGQKVAFSFLTAIFLFAGFVFFAQTGLMAQIETKFYAQAKIAEKNEQLDKLSQSCNSYISNILAKIQTDDKAYLKSSAVRTYAHQTPSEKDATERKNLTAQLFDDLEAYGFDGMRLIEKNGRTLHYSSYESDVLKRVNLNTTYKLYSDIVKDSEQIDSGKLLVNNDNPETKILIDTNKNQLVFSFPFYITDNTYFATLVCYFNIYDFEKSLLNEKLINVNDSFIAVADDSYSGGFVLGLPKTAQNEFLQPVNSVWKKVGKNNSEGLERILEKSDGSYWLLMTSTLDDYVKVSAVYSSSLFQLPREMEYLIYVCVFTTFLLLMSLLFNLKRDYMAVIKSRIKKVQFGIINEYLENKEKVNWNQIARQLENRKAELSEEIKKSIGGKSKKYSKQVDAYLESSWADIIGMLKVQNEGEADSLNGATIEEIRKVIEDVLQTAKINVNVDTPVTAVKTKKTVPVVDEVEEIEEVEEIADAEELDEVEEIEEVEEIADAEELDEVEEIEEIADAEELDEVEEIEEVEEIADAEELDEVEEIEEVEEIADAEELDEVEEIEEIEEIADAEELDEVEEIEEIEEITEAEELDEVEEIEEVEEIADAEEFDEVEEITEAEGLDEVEEIAEAEDLDEVEEIEEVEEIAEAEEPVEVEENIEIDDLNIPDIPMPEIISNDDEILHEELVIGRIVFDEEKIFDRNFEFVAVKPEFFKDGKKKSVPVIQPEVLEESSEEVLEEDSEEILEETIETVEEAADISDEVIEESVETIEEPPVEEIPTEEPVELAEETSVEEISEEPDETGLVEENVPEEVLDTPVTSEEIVEDSPAEVLDEPEEIEEAEMIPDMPFFSMTQFAANNKPVVDLVEEIEVPVEVIVEKNGVYSVSDGLVYENVTQDLSFKALVDSVLQK